MSTSRGNICRTRPQKHQNKTAFKNDLHNKSNKIKFLNSMNVSEVCTRCKDKIEWKIKYKKYKPLTVPKTCVRCKQKSVKLAYHVLCHKCASDNNVCSKCCKPVEKGEPEEIINIDIQNMLKGLPERKRRTVLRFLNKQTDQQKAASEIMGQIEGMLSEIDKMKLDDDLDFSSSNGENDFDSENDG